MATVPFLFDMFHLHLPYPDPQFLRQLVHSCMGSLQLVKRHFIHILSKLGLEKEEPLSGELIEKGMLISEFGHLV